MARTVAELITAVRTDINDADSAGYRVSNDELRSYAVDGLNFLRNARPDLFIGQLGDDFESLAADDDLPINAQFYRPLVDYVIGRAELRDDEAAVGGRAELAAKLAQGFLS